MKKIIRSFGEGDTRYWIFNMVFENSNEVSNRCLRFNINFCTGEHEITISIGYIFGTFWLSIPNDFLFRNFRWLFDGKEFGEWGREIGFTISSYHINYSLWWYSDCNAPAHKWRKKYWFLRKI